MHKLGRFQKRWVLWAAVLVTGVLPTHCVTTLQDAALTGAAQVVTSATTQILSSFLPFPLNTTGGSTSNTGGSGSGSGTDPFSNQPLQS